jgi:molybdopterin/thiamine biosynthesis adenylyltransferase
MPSLMVDLMNHAQQECAPASGLPPGGGAESAHSRGWTYEEAFRRNRGLITEAEQQRLRDSRVAIAGMGGVGGVHLATLARLGIGKFTIADPDVFEVANFNRQYGATVSNLGRNKAEAMAEAALDIDPQLDIRVMPTGVGPDNIGQFLDGADLFVDGLDFFSIEVRRLVFRRAADRGIWSVTAGPLGFSTAWLAFDPQGMSFDRYFDLDDRMGRLEQLVAFAVGLTPRATHLAYMDLSQASIKDKTGPSASLACQLASGVAGAYAVQILLGKGPIAAAPIFHQFDPWRGVYRKGRLYFGNRGPIQRLKRKILARRFAS